MIPAGLFCDKVEFFVFEEELFALFKGTKYHWKDLPPNIWEQMVCLFDISPKRHYVVQMGIQQLENQVVQYFSCLYGGIDNKGDVCTMDSSFEGVSEYWPCPKRGECPFEGKLCELPGGLSRREIEVVKVMSMDLSMYQMADRLNIAYGTLIAHKSSIFAKLNVKKNTAVISWAAEHKII